MNRNKDEASASSLFSQRQRNERILRLWMITNVSLIILAASILLVQAGVLCEALPLERERERTLSHRTTTVNDVGGNAVEATENAPLSARIRAKRMKPAAPIRQLLGTQPETQQQPSPRIQREEKYTVSLAFSLWLGTKSTSGEENSTTTTAAIIPDYEEIERWENNGTNPIHLSVMQSLWQVLCTRPNIQLLHVDDKAYTNSVMGTWQRDACVNLLPGGKHHAHARSLLMMSQRRRRLRQQLDYEVGGERETEGSSSNTTILRKTPSLVTVEQRQEEGVAWTEWTITFEVERIGYRYMQLALQEKKSLSASSYDATSDSDDYDTTLDRAAVEILQESLQLLLDIAILTGPMDQVLQKRLKSNTMLDNPEAPYYTVLSSPVGGELEAFPQGKPTNVFIDNDEKDKGVSTSTANHDYDGDKNTTNTSTATDPPQSSSPPTGVAAETTATTDEEIPKNTFEYSAASGKRLLGIFWFIATTLVYCMLLRLARKRRRRLAAPPSYLDGFDYDHDGINVHHRHSPKRSHRHSHDHSSATEESTTLRENAASSKSEEMCTLEVISSPGLDDDMDGVVRVTEDTTTR